MKPDDDSDITMEVLVILTLLASPARLTMMPMTAKRTVITVTSGTMMMVVIT